MSSELAVQPMTTNGPGFTVTVDEGDCEAHVRLWLPNATREHTSIGWTWICGESQRFASDYERGADLTAAFAALDRLPAAALAAEIKEVLTRVVRESTATVS